MEKFETFKAGDIVINEGAKETSAYVILSGTAKVLKKIGGREVTIAILEKGQVFGEMGLIEDRPRSATVRADSMLRTTVINRDSFNELLKTNPSVLMPILKTLFERLRQASEMLAQRSAGLYSEIKEDKGFEIIMEGRTDEAKAVLSDRKLLITKFPFLIGRQSTDDPDSDVFSHNDLAISEKKSNYISGSHLAIIHDRGMMWVVDRGSAYGIIVNGKDIGGLSNETRAILDKEENQIVIGPVTSRYIFLLKIVVL